MNTSILDGNSLGHNLIKIHKVTIRVIAIIVGNFTQIYKL